jgi:phage shock protein A
MKCQSAFKDFSSTLEEKEARINSLEEDITTLQEAVAGHKVQLETLLRDLEKVSQEKHEAVADVITAREEQELSDMIAGISQDRTSEELQELRDLREKAKASARVSREMAGLDTKRSEEEFLQYAEQSAADTEFDALIGLTRETEAPPTEEPEDRSRLPEQ